jgi:DNA polymerase I-like protein with 3'-5' exonuclease and polymerase domains
VASELFAGRTLRLWADEMHRACAPPYDMSADSLFVAYYASAEFLCHLQLGWALPASVVDLFAEFRAVTNGRTLVSGAGLLGALAHYGLDALAAHEKESMRELALRGGPYSGSERRALLDYCASDVDALRRLLGPMEKNLDIDRALIRGDYMKAVARMEFAGVPVDVAYLGKLNAGWSSIRASLIERIDADYGVFEGESFKEARFERMLARHGIGWPRTATGRLQLDEDTFRTMARAHPSIAVLHELRVSLAQLRLGELEIGLDGRNRTMLSAFRARTGRNAPRTSRFIFGRAAWVRGLIKPAHGRALAYVDYSQQEFAIAGALSGDQAMLEAYNSGDPYLAFAKQAGAAPPHATKESHETIRDCFKACSLGVLYGMGAETLGQRIAQPVPYARDLLRVHRDTYPTYWRWSDGVVDHAMLFGHLHTVFGWPIAIGPDTRPASLRNWPVQSTGAEVLRLACCLATEAGIVVCAPVHDALLIEAADDEIAGAVALTRELMAEAGRIVLDGFALRTDATVVSYPNRYADKRGARMWVEVERLLGAAAVAHDPCADASIPGQQLTPASLVFVP